MEFNVAAADTGGNRKAGFGAAPVPSVETSNETMSTHEAILKLIEDKGEIDFTDIAIKDLDYDEARSVINQLEDDGIIVFSEDKYKLKKPDNESEDYKKALEYIKKNRNGVSPIRLYRELGLSLDDANDILDEMERKGHVSAAAPSGERKILVEPDVAPPPFPPINNDADQGEEEADMYPHFAIKLQHFDVLSNILASKFPGQKPLNEIIKPSPIGFKETQEGFYIESDKFSEKLKINNKKIEAEIENDKTLSVEAVYMMVGVALAQGMKSVTVNGTDEEKLLLAVAAMQFGLKVSNLNEVQALANGAQDTLEAVKETWSEHMKKMHPESQPQKARPRPTPPSGPAP